MQINIHSPFTIDDELKALIHEKVEKLTTYSDGILNADIHLRLRVSTVPNGKTVEITLHLPGEDAFAKGSATTFEKAVAETATKLKQQLKKRKGIFAKKY